MRSGVSLLSLLLCLLVLLSLKTYSVVTKRLIDRYPCKVVYSGLKHDQRTEDHETIEDSSERVGDMVEPSILPKKGTFTVIIVTFNEVLLEKTFFSLLTVMSRVLNVLGNTKPGYVDEVLIIDDHSDIPVEWDANETRVRIIRNGWNHW